jgi:hypothetical protein
VRVCIECGIPIAEHRDWCSILRTQRELDQKARQASQSASLKAEEGLVVPVHYLGVDDVARRQ